MSNIIKFKVAFAFFPGSDRSHWSADLCIFSLERQWHCRKQKCL